MYNPDRFLHQPIPPRKPIMSIVGGIVAIIGFLAFAGNRLIPGFGLNWSFDPFSPFGVALTVIGASIVLNRLRPH